MERMEDQLLDSNYNVHQPHFHTFKAFAFAFGAFVEELSRAVSLAEEIAVIKYGIRKGDRR